LSEDCIEYMKSDIRFRDFFKNEMFQHKNFSEEFMEEQIAFYSTENFNVSNKVKLALETTLPGDMYQYDYVHGDILINAFINVGQE
jgi:hypothetical protein